MINSVIVRIVDTCARYRWTTIIAGALLMLGAGTFAATKFSIDTNVEGLISQDLPWHQRQLEMSRAFPQNGISVVVKAPTSENAELATNALAQRLSKNQNLFPLVGQPDSGVFFERNGLLFGSPAEVKRTQKDWQRRSR
jgi:predicted RND superfamily exporter protein